MIAPDREAYATRLYPALLDHLLREIEGPYSLWWTSGSDSVEPSFRIFRGFPEPEAFSSFLTDGVTPQPAAVPALCDDMDVLDATLGEET